MSGLQRPAALEALNTALFKTFQEGMRQPSFAETAGFFTSMPSSTEFNTYGWLANVSGMREWIGHRIIDGLKERSYTIYNKDYEKTIGVARNALDDGNVADATFAMQQLVEAAQRLPDDLLLALMEGGQAATVAGLAYDGQYFYDTDHPTSLDSTGTQRNYYASGLGLDATNLKTIIASMKNFKGENGLPLGIGQNGLTLVVPPALFGTAVDAVEAKTVSTGGENMLASSKYNIKVVEWARLSSTTRFFLFDLASPGPKPFILQRRKNPQFVDRNSPDGDEMFNNKRYVWGVDARMGAGYGLWFKAYSSSS